MDTTKIRIRPFVPYLKDEKAEKREPFALLTYGNVTIELDMTIMEGLRLTTSYAEKTCMIAHCGFDEIKKEMWVDLEGELPRYHRDSEEQKELPLTHNWCSRLENEKYIQIKE